MAIPKRPLNELMKTIKANIKRYRAEQALLPEPSQARLRLTRTAIMELEQEQREAAIEFTSRTADQEICAVEICPEHPEYMIIGTYSLVKKDETRDYEAQTRRGSLQITTVAPTFKPKYAGMLAPHLDRIDFPCAILDLHFHPADRTLLGVATSNAQMHFFRFVKHGDVLGRRVITKLLPLGTAAVSDQDEHGLVALVTQFTWFPETRVHGVSGISDVQEVSLALTTSFGETKIVSTAIPAIKDLFDERASHPLAVRIVDVHKHDLEAWTVAAVVTQGSNPKPDASDNSASFNRLILSGGDDSALIASMVEMPLTTSESASATTYGDDDGDGDQDQDEDEDENPATHILPLWKDRRTHTAGVVAILPLPRIRNLNHANDQRATFALTTDDDATFIPLVTGSYDEFIRIYELDDKSFPHRATFKTELRLNGGVWRLKVLDQYSTNINTNAVIASPASPQQYHTLILASLMHGGAALLRLTYTPTSSSDRTQSTPQHPRSNPDPGWDSWTLTPLTTFRTGHESMVYCCDAWLEDANTFTYTIVSTSFYDMKICTWKFVDRFKAELGSQ